MVASFKSNCIVQSFGMLFIMAASALSSGCSGVGNQSPPGVLSAGAVSTGWQPVQPIAALQPGASAGTLYASSPGANTVTEYQLPGDAIIGTLGASSGLSAPGGLFFSKEHLYVTNGNQVLIFGVGQTMPTLTIRDPAPFADDVVVGNDGTVYVANEEDDYEGYGDVLVFKKNRTVAEYTIIPPKVNEVGSVTLDSSNNLYIAYTLLNNSTRIEKYAPGSQKGEDTRWSLGYPGGMAFDKSGNLVIADKTRIDVFAPGAAKPTRTFGSLSYGVSVRFNQSQTHLFATDYGANQIDEFDYATGDILKAFSLAGAAGLAIDPPASL